MTIKREKLIHLVGSVALKDSTQVFTETCNTLGPYLSAVPDGETGERIRWVYFQRTMLENHPAMEIDEGAEPVKLHSWDGKLLHEETLFRFKPDIEPDTVQFETGYDNAAEYSYREFVRLRRLGIVPERMRFQVSLPTPIATSYIYVSPEARADYHRVYEKSLLRAAERIFNVIPHDDLTIQFDVCLEVLIFEDYFKHRPVNYKDEIFAMLARLGQAVPGDIPMGYHLCYGSARNQHLVMPVDTAILVEMMNGITNSIGRDINFFHIPVPQDRFDHAYYAPMTGLALDSCTHLYMGLIHPEDDEGNEQRYNAAKKFIRNFGIATECGFGRIDEKLVPGLLKAHKQLAEKITSSG